MNKQEILDQIRQQQKKNQKKNVERVENQVTTDENKKPFNLEIQECFTHKIEVMAVDELEAKALVEAHLSVIELDRDNPNKIKIELSGVNKNKVYKRTKPKENKGFEK
jgi:hypothetical protein